MLIQDMAEAIGRAQGAALDAVTRALWAAVAAGQVGDDDAAALSAAIEARRAVPSPARGGGGRSVSVFPTPIRRPQRPPVRSVAIERRRRLAASGPMPPALAARFTQGELAVMRIVVDEVAARGSCVLCLDAIAARAGVSRTLAKAAIRQARRLGMVEVRERRRTGAKSLPNVVTVIDREWLAWIKRGNRIGGRNSTTTDTSSFRGVEKADSVRGKQAGHAGALEGRTRQCAPGIRRLDRGTSAVGSSRGR